MNRTFALAATAAALSCPASATGVADQPVHTEIVAIADLDLSSAAGIRALDRRILTAVQIACGSASDADIAGGNAVRRCQKLLFAQLATQRNKLVAGGRPIDLAATAH